MGRTLARAFSPVVRRPIASVPSRLTVAPELLAVGRPEEAEAIYAGHFALAGRRVDVAGHSPFSVTPPSQTWAEALHGFRWLADLNESASKLSSNHARALVDEWLAGGHAFRGADAPELTAARLTSWLAYAPLLLDGADAAFARRLMRAVARHTRRIETALALREGAALPLAAAFALAGVCAEGQGRVRRTGLAALEQAVGDAVLPDGGHASRSPAAIVDALETLMPVERAIEAAQFEVPRWLSGAIDKMLPMLGFFGDGAGGILDLEGGGPVTGERVEAVRDFSRRTIGQSGDNARYVGFQRAAAGKTVVLVDTGLTPPPAFAMRAHAAPLSVTVLDGPYMVFGGCGALDRASASLASVGRVGAAHSTLVIADTSVARVATLWGARLSGGPKHMKIERKALAVRARHDGYQPRFGVVHERTVRLSKDGRQMAGVDKLVGSERLAGRPFAVRFHLASTTRVRLERRRRRALLCLASGTEWLFRVDQGPDIYVEESVVLEGDAAMPSQQLVLTGNTLTDPEVRWQVVRQDGGDKDE